MCTNAHDDCHSNHFEISCLLGAYQHSDFSLTGEELGVTQTYSSHD